MPAARSRRQSLVLEEFIPFRLNRLADAVSRNLSTLYRDRFQLEIPEWRALVTIGRARGCTAQHIAASSRMHKTRVSRAVQALERRGLIERALSEEDGREMSMSLTTAGREIYETLVPLALERERQLMACLTDRQRGHFIRALTALEGSLDLQGDA